MTDRYNALTVVLNRDIREDDAQGIIEAIMMIKGVADVSGNIADVDSYVSTTRVNAEWRTKLYNLIDEMNKKQ